MPSSTILVTGAAGFIGSHTTERLLAEGYQVVGLDNFDPFYARSIKEKNLEPSLAHPSFRFVECALEDQVVLRELFEQTAPDAVIHLAATAGVRPSIERPLAYVQANYVATATLLDEMRKAGCRALVFGSSSSVYGGSSTIPFTEDQPVDRPISPYAATKKACEVLNHVYHHLYGMSVINLRFFTVYGPRQRPDLAIHKFTRKIDRGEPIPVFGDGSSQRDYTYIDDILDGLFKATERVLQSPDALFETFNLGESHTIRLAELIALIEEALGKKANIDRRPPQPGDMPATYADVTAAREVLGYEPRVPIEQGIERFVRWYRGEF